VKEQWVALGELLEEALFLGGAPDWQSESSLAE